MPFHQQEALMENDLSKQIHAGALSPFQPKLSCPNCGSKPPIWKVGCQYQDCEDCTDSEVSSCSKCGYGVGGAAYWR